MRPHSRLLLLAVLLYHLPLFAQKYSYDSLMKKGNQELYNNPDNTLKIGNAILKNEKDINKLSKTYLLMSTAEIAKRDFNQSLIYITKARELVDKINNPEIKSIFFVAVAVQFQQMELYSNSIQNLDDAAEYLARLPESSLKHYELAIIYTVRGIIYKSQSNPEIALQKFIAAINNFEKVKEKKTTFFNQSIVYYNIGYCYLGSNQFEKANQAFRESLMLAKMIQAKSLEAYALKGIAEIKKNQNQNKTALGLLIQAQDLSKDIKDLTLNESIFKELSDNYLVLGNQELYQLYNKKFLDTKLTKQQNELRSINRSIDNHNIEIQTQTDQIISHYNYIILFSAIAIALILVILCLRIIKIMRCNKKSQDKIKKLFRS